MLVHEATATLLAGVNLSSWTNPSTSSSPDQIPSSSVTNTFSFTPTLFNKHHTALTVSKAIIFFKKRQILKSKKKKLNRKTPQISHADCIHSDNDNRSHNNLTTTSMPYNDESLNRADFKEPHSPWTDQQRDYSIALQYSAVSHQRLRPINCITSRFALDA